MALTVPPPRLPPAPFLICIHFAVCPEGMLKIKSLFGQNQSLIDESTEFLIK